MASLFLLVYRLRAHRFGAWTLMRWAATVTLGVSATILVQWLLRGQSRLPAWYWLVLGLLLAVGVGLPAFGAWAARRGYVIFRPELGLAAPAARSLAPEDKVQLHATGRFEVNGKARPFADLLAYWRTFGSREHAVMAVVQWSRFLLLGHLPDDQIGMWYIFVRPEDILTIVPGHLTFGSQTGPALRFDYRHTPPAKEGKRPPKPIVAAVHLRFPDEETRGLVWADLLLDWPTMLPPHTPPTPSHPSTPGDPTPGGR